MVCPSQESLRSFLKGQLTDPGLDEVGNHLDACTRCLNSLAALKANDPLANLAHSLKRNNLVGQESPAVEALVSRVCGRVSSAITETLRATRAPSDTQPELARKPAAMPVIPGFEILEFMDGGGMGIVYKARHVHLDKIMAIKVCSRERLSPEMRERFRQEMLAVGRLNDPHIVQAHDAGTTADGVPYLAMEFLEGRDLAQEVKRHHPLPVTKVCEYVYQASVGLQHAHEKGMVHRDLKPSNLFLTTSGTVKILDLGLARLHESVPRPEEAQAGAIAAIPDLNGTGAGMGTAEYMAPEQWLDAHAVDVRADLYSLGCTLYHLLTGSPPFEGNAFQQRQAHLTKTATPLRQLRPDVPVQLSDLVNRLLAKNAADRPATPAEVAVALKRFIPEPRGRLKLLAQLMVGAAAFFALLLVLGGVIYVATDRGTVVIKTDDPDVEVAVKQNGQIIKILDKKTGKEFTFRSGIYELELLKGKDGLRLTSTRLELHRGDRRIVEVYLEKPAGWIKKKPLIAPALGMMAGVINDQIVVVGGQVGGSSLPTVQIYDPGKDEWTADRTPMPKTDQGDAGRYNGSVVVKGGKLHVLGGWRVSDRLPSTSHMIYDPAKDGKGGNKLDAWARGEPLPLRSGMSVAGIINNKLYLLTGLDGTDGYFRHLHMHDFGAKPWAKRKSPPNSHVGGTGGVINGKLYVVGGLDANGLPTPHLDVYDPATGEWTTRRALPFARSDLGGAVVNGKLYVAGGVDAGRKILADVAVYDPSTDAWTELTPLTAPRQLLTMAAIGNTLYAIGGYDGKTHLGTMEALDLEVQATPTK